ncbi:MAG: AMP-binding protein [Rhizobiaceae bacterium]|nr:AMP-binding protein [Rhizobiaceae bacterium]
MFDFGKIDRTYVEARKNFKQVIPDQFNFAFDVIDVHASKADKTAIIAVSGDGQNDEEISFKELSEKSNRAANGFQSLGLEKGDFACVVIGRIPAWYHVLFGCMKSGIVSMPGTNLLTAKDIEYRVNYSKAKAIIVSAEHCEKIEEIRDNCPTLQHFIVVGREVDNWINFENLCKNSEPTISTDSRVITRSDDMMMAYFTSGTTAMPKMVPRNFGYALAHSATALFWMDLRRDDIHWTLTDTGWAKAAWGMLFPQFLIGTTVILYNGESGFDVELHLKMISKYKVSTFCAPPTVYRLFAQQNLSNYDFSSIRRSLGAGEPLNPEVIRLWKSATGTTIADGYGQTETINIVANYPDQEVKVGSMGQPVPGFDVDIIDDDGNRLPCDEIGHIAINTENGWPSGLFAGYYAMNGLDRKSFRKGWYFTGDTATRDKDGYIWFVGRADDLISSAGYRISPFEVESSLLEHPAVAESAVIGVADDTRGQVVKAYIILARDYNSSDQLAKEIQAFCKLHTAPYKYPREIEFVDELPKTISGKIRRVELRESEQ